MGGSETFFSGADGIRMVPGDGATPLSLLTDENSEPLSFPKIFVGEKLAPTHNGKDVTYSSICKSMVRHHDRRAVRTDFLFLYGFQKTVTKFGIKSVCNDAKVQIRFCS